MSEVSDSCALRSSVALCTSLTPPRSISMTGGATCSTVVRHHKAPHHLGHYFVYVKLRKSLVKLTDHTIELCTASSDRTLRPNTASLMLLVQTALAAVSGSATPMRASPPAARAWLSQILCSSHYVAGHATAFDWPVLF
jgi:hypothetical protein